MARPNFALASATYPNVNSAYKRGAFLQVVVAFAAGAPSIVEARSAPGFTIADGATGAYTGTAPTAERGVLLTQVMVPSAADSNVVTVTSYDPVTGVFALQSHANAAPADIPDNAELWLLFLLEGG
jgi:hypothetical protein